MDTLANGAVLVSNPERGLWRDGEEWRLEEDLRIGVMDGDGPELFGEIIALRSDALGRIYVADSQASEIRVFDMDGRHVRSFGRTGAGPGELARISGMDWDPDGNLWVMEAGNSRLSVFDTTGTFLTSHRRPGGFSMMPWAGGLDRDGNVYDMNAITADLSSPRRGFIRHDLAFAPRDTFELPEFEQASFDLSDSAGRRRMSVTVPFTPAQFWTLTPAGDFWIGVNDRYRLHRVSFSGDTTRIVEKPFTPGGVTAAERESAIEDLSWFTEQGGRIDPSRIPARKPAFGAPFEDSDGYLWVAAIAEAGANTAFDLFDPEGRYLGRVQAPVEVRMRPVVHDGAMYTYVRDDLGVPYVVRLRIVRTR